MPRNSLFPPKKSQTSFLALSHFLSIAFSLPLFTQVVMLHRHTRHHSSSTTVSDLHPFAPSPTPLPPLPQTPISHSRTRPTTPYQSASTSHPQPHHEDIDQGMFSRRSRSLSRSGRSTPLLFPHARQIPQPHANLDLSSAFHSQELLDQAFQPLPASSIYSSSHHI